MVAEGGLGVRVVDEQKEWGVNELVEDGNVKDDDNTRSVFFSP